MEIYFKTKKYTFETEQDALSWLKAMKRKYFSDGYLGKTCWFEAMKDYSGEWSDDGFDEYKHIVYSDSI